MQNVTGQLATIFVNPLEIAQAMRVLRDGVYPAVVATGEHPDYGLVSGLVLAFHPEICKVTILVHAQEHKR